MFLCPRGHVVQTSTGGGGKSYYYVKGLSTAKDVIITNIPVGSQDIIGASSSLGGTKTLYAFGKAFGTLSISGIVLLGDCLASTSSSVKKIEEWYNKNRVTVAKKPVSISYGHAGGGKSVYPVNLQFPDLDNSKHIQSFIITCVVVEI